MILTNTKKPIANTAIHIATKARPAPEKFFDMGALNDIATGNKDFIVALVKIYLETIPANSSEMVIACSAGNWDLVSKLAHKLKSTVDMMRMTMITQDIRTIELDAKNNVNKDLLPALVEKVDHVIKTVAQQLQHEFSL